MDSLLDQSALTDARRAAGGGRARGRRRRRRRGRDALGVAVGRGARRRGRGIRALRRQRHRPARPGRQAPGGGLDQRHRGDGVDALAERAVAMARVAPEDRFAGLADPALLARDISRSRSGRSRDCRTSRRWSSAARARRSGRRSRSRASAKSGGASASAGIGGMVLVTSHGFSGAYLGSRHGISMTAIAGEGTGMERDYDYSSALHAADLDAPEKIGRTAGERAVERLNPRKVVDHARCRWCSTARVAGSLVGHLAGAINGASIARKTSFLKDKLGERLFAPGIRIIDDPLRRRGLRSQPFDAEGVAGRALRADRGRRAQDLAARLAPPRASSACRPPAMPSAARPRRRRRGRPICIWSRARSAASELIADIDEGFYVTDLIGSGANSVTGDYSRGASGFWIENGELHLSGERGHHRRPSARHVPHADAGQRSRIPLRHQRADRARRGADRCRSSELPRDDAADARARSRAAVREAGALALEILSRHAQELDQGHGDSPVTEADIAVNDLLHERLPARRATAGCRRRARTIRRGCGARGSGSSIRSTAPAPSSPAARTGRSPWRWSRTAGRCSPRCLRRRPTRCSWRARARGATRNGAPIAASARRGARRRPHRRPEAHAGAHRGARIPD